MSASFTSTGDRDDAVQDKKRVADLLLGAHLLVSSGVLSFQGHDEPPQDPLHPVLLVDSSADRGEQGWVFTPVCGEFGERYRR
jgi:hypothetical protein